MNLAPEVEAPRDDTFGLAAAERERREERLDLFYRRAYRVIMIGSLVIAAAWVGYHWRTPEKPYAVASGQLLMTCELDHSEKCSVCTFTDSRGRVRHKNTHCPALEASGLMGWPVGEKP